MTTADLIIYNAKVFTANRDQASAEAVAVKANKILYVGANKEALELQASTTKLIDAQSKTLMPGIIDSHFHLYWGALNLANIQLEDVRGITNLRKKVQAFKQAHPEKRILRGSSLAYDVLPEGERLNRHYVDEIESDLPLILVSFDFHTAWCNTAALKAAGILEGISLEGNSEVVMGADGFATGELREFEAMALITDLIPEPSLAEKENLLKEAIHLAHSYGITSIHNMNGNREEFALYQALDEAKDLSLRIYFPYRMYPTSPMSDIENEALYLKNLYASDKLKAGALKLFMDGVIEGFTAFMLDPYINDPSTKGEAIFEAEHFNEICAKADKLGLQLAVHAIGDAAIKRTLDGFEHAQNENGVRDSRHRVEHIELLHSSDLTRFAELDVIVSMQPYHCSRPEIDYLAPYLNFIPKERYKDCFPWQSLRDTGAKMSFGSDWPVVSMNPFFGFDAAVNREPWAQKLNSEARSLEETLLAYTKDAAYVEFAEKEKGQLKEGMLADMLLLSEAIFEISRDKLKDLNAQLTIVDGVIVYERVG